MCDKATNTGKVVEVFIVYCGQFETSSDARKAVYAAQLHSSLL